MKKIANATDTRFSLSTHDQALVERLHSEVQEGKRIILDRNYDGAKTSLKPEQSEKDSKRN